MNFKIHSSPLEIKHFRRRRCCTIRKLSFKFEIKLIAHFSAFTLTRRMNHLLLIIRSYSTLLEKFNFLKKKTKLSHKAILFHFLFFGNFFSKKKEKTLPLHYYIGHVYRPVFNKFSNSIFSKKRKKKHKALDKKNSTFFLFHKESHVALFNLILQYRGSNLPNLQN